MAPKISPTLIRFGVFEVDLHARELRKYGRKIKLQDLPFQFLMALLEQPNQLITRDELARRLWSEDALIDIDNGLNTAAKKLRVALGDDAETPRFIETLPRRGYRFIGVVQPAEPTEPNPPVEVAPAPVIPTAPLVNGQPAPAAHTPATPARSRRWIWALAGLFLLILAAWSLMPSRPPAMLGAVQLTHFGRVEPYDTILTDGSRIYFIERTGGSWGAGQVSVEGGTPSPVTTPQGTPELRDISPNKSELLVNIAVHNEEDAPLWVVPTVAGSPRRLGSILSHAAAWSRDGRTVIYAFGAALYRMNSDGTNSRKLADTPGKPYFIQWSPPGQPDRLRFTMVTDGPRYSIWECLPDGSGLRRYPPSSMIPAARAGQMGAGWTRDGRYYLFQSVNERGIVFWAYRESRSLLHPFDRRPVQIYATPTGAAVLVPNLDGQKVFFAVGKENRELVSFDAKRNVFLPFLSGAPVRDVAFSKDGRWVAYQTIPESALWRSRADGTERMQLTSPPLGISSPRWSPDGQRIAIEAYPREVGQVFVIPSGGGALERISLEPNKGAGSPSWSPDGQALMYGCWPLYVQPAWPEICVYDFKTRQTAVLPGTRDLLRPAWSPDGQYVAALSKAGTQVVLYEIKTRTRTVVADAANYGIPFWTRDSRYFYFEKVIGDVDQPIFRANVATHAAERMMSLKQLPQSSFIGYTLTGITPDDEPIATVIRSNGDLYALDVDLP
ncbi:MAG: winged helix-turn-helix domain-containing protein [Bryobacteraceae bacterium]